MKFILVPVLMLLLLTQTFSKWLVVMEYAMNRDFIAKNLCVNKAKPKLHCKGKCQMMKRLAEEEKQNTDNTGNNSKIKIQEIVFCHQVNRPAVPALTGAAVIYNEEPPAPKYNSPAYPFFHPPAMG